MKIEKRGEYYLKNKEKILAYGKKYYRDHLEECRLHNKEYTNEYYETIRGKFTLWRKGAKRRNISWELSDKDVDELLKPMVCYYTNVPLTLERSKPNTVSIDRVNSDLGYVKGNVVICQSTVNFMKGTLSTTEFIKFCRNIVNHYDRTEDTDYAI